MKKIFFVLSFMAVVASCAQDKKNPVIATLQPIEKNRNITITAQNFVDQMVAQTTHFNDQPIYYLRINKVNLC